MAFRNPQHLSSFGGAAEQNSMGVAGCQRFGAGMYERLEFSAKAHFSGPLVGAVPFNAVHRSCTEDPQLDEAASRRSNYKPASIMFQLVIRHSDRCESPGRR